ncbi:MAG TPA: MFS transporter [Spirochaetia bacterium]|nr:MFS transporter [Spirochaetia bacterium]
MEESATAAPARRGAFAALSYPNYRLWFAGQMTSLFGTWMQSTAQGYLVFELTHSEAYLGYVGFASGVATWAFTLYGGVVADRVPRRSLIIVTQSLSMLLAFALSALTFLRVVAPWHIVLLAFFLGVVNAFDAPARQAFVLEMVDRPMLTNAIALNSMMFNTATAVGPAVGGLTYALFGPGWCFAINGLSFVAVIAALLSMRLGPWTPPQRRGSTFGDIREGLRAVAADRRIIGIICLVASVSLFAMSFSTLVPAWAVQILHGDARVNGLLQSARGLGALSAALWIAAVAHRRRKGMTITAASLVFPALLILFSFTRTLPLSLLALVAVGAANITVNNLANALVQTLTPDAVRGRVMGVYMLAFFGFMPLGALGAGALATVLGAPVTILIGAGATLACAVAVAAAVPSIRRLD